MLEEYHLPLKRLDFTWKNRILIIFWYRKVSFTIEHIGFDCSISLGIAICRGHPGAARQLRLDALDSKNHAETAAIGEIGRERWCRWCHQWNKWRNHMELQWILLDPNNYMWYLMLLWMLLDLTILIILIGYNRSSILIL